MRTCLAAFFILVVTPVLSGEQVRHLDVVLDGLVNVYSYPGRAPVIIVYAARPIGRRSRATR